MGRQRLSLKAPDHTPTPYAQFGFASLGGRAVYFGSNDGTEDKSTWDHTWEWDGVDWTQKTPSVHPSARSAPAMATFGNKVVLFGGGSLTTGSGTTVPRDDTWEWDGTAWTQLSPQQSPEPRSNAATALTAVGSKLVLFGGADGLGTPVPTAWEWDGVSWAPRAGTLPPARLGGVLATLGGKGILYGGGVKSLGLALTDMWILAP